jgi:hypothetical protein
MMPRNEIIDELFYYSNAGHIKNLGRSDVAGGP